MESGNRHAAWTPAVDVYEYLEGFVICLEVPGIEAEDLEVLIQGRTVRLRGSRDLPIPSRMTAHRVELRRGRFERDIRLPVALDPDRSSTQLAGGLLLVHVPKATPARRIRVDAPGHS